MQSKEREATQKARRTQRYVYVREIGRKHFENLRFSQWVCSANPRRQLIKPYGRERPAVFQQPTVFSAISRLSNKGAGRMPWH